MEDREHELLFQQIRGELSAVRGDVGGIRDDVSALAAELRTFTADQGSRVAVVEHRVGAVEGDINDLRNERARQRGQTWAMVVAIVGAVISGVGSIVTQMMGT